MNDDYIICSSLIDAQRLVNEMHHFYTEPNRKLTCRLVNIIPTPYLNE